MAVQNEHTDTVTALLEMGANPEISFSTDANLLMQFTVLNGTGVLLRMEAYIDCFDDPDNI